MLFNVINVDMYNDEWVMTIVMMMVVRMVMMMLSIELLLCTDIVQIGYLDMLIYFIPIFTVL